MRDSAQNILKIAGLLENDHQIVFDFFITFARLECELIAAKYVYPGEALFISSNHSQQRDHSWKASLADWRGFVSAAEALVPDAVATLLQTFTSFMSEDPPSVHAFHQTTKVGSWGYPEKDWPTIRSIEGGSRQGKAPALLELTILVRRVRNNLFHGKKLVGEPRERTLYLLDNTRFRK